MAKKSDDSDAADESELEEEREKQGEAISGDGVSVVPGVLTFYDTATKLFGIRYPHGNR